MRADTPSFESADFTPCLLWARSFLFKYKDLYALLHTFLLIFLAEAIPSL